MLTNYPSQKLNSKSVKTNSSFINHLICRSRFPVPVFHRRLFKPRVCCPQCLIFETKEEYSISPISWQAKDKMTKMLFRKDFNFFPHVNILMIWGSLFFDNMKLTCDLILLCSEMFTFKNGVSRKHTKFILKKVLSGRHGSVYDLNWTKTNFRIS